jgi:hypothetical protein
VVGAAQVTSGEDQVGAFGARGIDMDQATGALLTAMTHPGSPLLTHG